MVKEPVFLTGELIQIGAVRRSAFELTEDRCADYQQCAEQAAAWNRCVIPRIRRLNFGRKICLNFL